MLSNYFKIALRYFRRNQLYTSINILGLSIGTAACLVIFLIVNYENSFDKFWQDKDQVHRVYSKFSGVFQFGIAQVLIFGTLTIGRQISYMMNIDMGFEKEAITYFYTPWQDTTDRKAVLLQELQRLPGITAISNHSSPPAETGYSTNVVKYNKAGEELQHNVHRKSGDTAYINLYEIDLLAGRNLLPSDTVKELMINETYLRKLGFEQPNEALGEYLDLGNKSVPIVGVVADFHIQLLRVSIEPTMIGGEVGNTISLKLQDTQNGPKAFARQASTFI